jgi:hypothetical protein
MLTTCVACVLGRKIMIQVNNLNTPVQVIRPVMQTKITHLY